jgi:hypothetical protein
MENNFIISVRELCRAVAEEANPDRLTALLDQLTQILDEHQLLASLL